MDVLGAGAECTFIVLDRAHEGATSYSLDGAFLIVYSCTSRFFDSSSAKRLRPSYLTMVITFPLLTVLPPLCLTPVGRSYGG